MPINYPLKYFKNILVVCIVLLFSKCAQITPLTGGKRDTVAPKIIKTTPENASINFKGETIELLFDEYVQVKDISNQLVVTPQPKQMPLVEAKGKKITVKFNEPLLPNATYRLFFGNAIADMHETNVLANYEFVFATGNYIDSLKLEGDVTNAFTLKRESDVIVGLYSLNESDSAIYLNKPVYFTKTNASGQFKLTNLPQNNYKIVAFTDKNKNLTFDSGEEMVGFKEKAVNAGNDTLIHFRIFKEDNSKQFLKKAFSPYYGMAYLVFNKEQLSEVRALSTNEYNKIKVISGINDTAFVYYHDIYDTLNLIVNNGLGLKKADTVKINVFSKEKAERLIQDKKLKLEVASTNLSGGTLPYYDQPEIKFTMAIDSLKLKQGLMDLYELNDTVKTKSEIKTQMINCNSLKIVNQLKPGFNYELILRKDAVGGYMDIKNDSLKYAFKTTDPEDYANLSIKLLMPGKENYMIELLNEKNQTVREYYAEQSISSSTEVNVQFRNLIPGNYYLKVFEDINKNKTWDTGTFLKKKNAEIIYINTTPVKLLANWDSETEWIIK